MNLSQRSQQFKFIEILVIILTMSVLLIYAGSGDEKQKPEEEIVITPFSETGEQDIETTSEETEEMDQSSEGERVLDSELYCLSLNIYHESRGDSFAGQAAVADVVLNRVEDTYYPNTVCEVVKQAVYIENWKGNVVPKRHMCQFSWYCDGISDEPGDPDAWMESYFLAEEVLTKDAWRGITEGATHYHAAHIRPNWTADRGMTYTGSIGGHEFYRWIR